MILERLVYSSSASPGIGQSDVAGIVDISVERNPDRGVTGFLIFDSDHFLQIIEGLPQDVDRLMDIIERDVRHCDIEVLDRRLVPERLFPDWRMKHLISFGEDPALEAVRDIVRGKQESAYLIDLVHGFVTL